MGSASSAAEARALLEQLGKTPFEFQCELAAQCLATVQRRERLLVVAPTGAGKTLIAQLSVALLGREHPDRYPRVLVVCPSRALLAQQLADAGWLREQRVAAIHALTPDLAPPIARALLSSWGVVYVTPVTLTRRLDLLGGADILRQFDLAVFDEIDTYLTIDELGERRDTWPALERCLDADLPVVGFTGTNLNSTQEGAWLARGFRKAEADVPHGWLPYTRVVFVGVQDKVVIAADETIREELRRAYGLLEEKHGSLLWGQLKALALQGDPTALRILELCYERLELFESLGSSAAKLAEVERVAGANVPTLVLSRYRHSARALLERLREGGLQVVQADGSMGRSDIERLTRLFRDADPSRQLSLIITRELGGRGLDFPSAGSAVVVSPRSNYQAVGQELARIRSRQDHPKEVRILYYTDTEEEAKARRLGQHLHRERFCGERLFDVVDLPAGYTLEPFESNNLSHEESLDHRTLKRLGSTALSAEA